MDRQPQLKQLWLDNDHKLYGLMTAPFSLNKVPVGTINTVFDGRELIEITETMMVWVKPERLGMVRSKTAALDF
ncbi:MAG: hypothetical protein R3D26_07975 [Cyanobacteriota/Melainabacteria group bacterium]